MRICRSSLFRGSHRSPRTHGGTCTVACCRAFRRRTENSISGLLGSSCCCCCCCWVSAGWACWLRNENYGFGVLGLVFGCGSGSRSCLEIAAVVWTWFDYGCLSRWWSWQCYAILTDMFFPGGLVSYSTRKMAGGYLRGICF